ncbi:MFS transporter [Naumannella halotolerans]|uniref:MFS transporter n=1 Tax=Naumannella halotolerans TaxID=993414 RepID=UPI001FBBE599|nr:MFS transporter [Naumannella halotolerans]
MNVPVGIAAFVIALIALKVPSRRSTTRPDVLGVILLTITTTCLIFFADFGDDSDHGWSALSTWAWCAGMVVAATLFVLTESRAEDPIIPLRLFRNRVFVNATAIGFMLGLGMFAAISFLPTFLQMVSQTSAAESGLLMLPMMGGMMLMTLLSGNLITRTGKYRAYPIIGMAVTGVVMATMTTLTGDTPLWLIMVYLFGLGCGLGLVMQVVVLVVQNAVPATEVGIGTSTNNYFREVGAALGVAVFGSIFTTRLSENLTAVFTGAGQDAATAAQSVANLDPTTLDQYSTELQQGVMNGYADALAPVFGYLVPFIAVAFVLALFLKQIPLGSEAGLVARGEAVTGAEADELEAGNRTGSATHHTGSEDDPDGRSPNPPQGEASKVTGPDADRG